MVVKPFLYITLCWK